MIGSLQPLCVQSTEDPEGLAAALEEWFTIEDSETVRVDEIEMAVEEQQLEQVDLTEMSFDEEQQHSEDVSDGAVECDTENEDKKLSHMKAW